MEVHHHPNVEKKNFKEYFLEFLMIFLAVTMGFFAENLREKIGNIEKERKYIIGLVRDLKLDTAEASSIIILENVLLIHMRSALQIPTEQLHNLNKQDTFYFHFLHFFVFEQKFKRNDNTLVKGMLQHSRSSTGVKEPTNINALAGEYLRLAYHGLRAKDKDFNSTLKTDFDNTIGEIIIIPQDIGRALLNLYNNAFYAVNEKPKAQSSMLNAVYEPTISVTTKKADNKISITVSDNGNGIPQKVVDKIFQPFFTTKPTGQGTGLGLSLSYDIIKAHGGEIKVETKEAEGSTFIIQLPA